MTISLRTLIPFILSALLMVSCGSDNDDNDDSSGGADVPETELPQAEEDANEPIRYSSVVMEENCGFWTDCDFIIRADYNRRPVILTANFIDNGWPENDGVPEEAEIDIGSCNFQVTLTEEQADKLESFADRLRICEVQNTPTTDRGFDGLFMTNSSGREFMVYKNRNGGQEEEGKINYLCGGRRGYYDYMKNLIVPRAPEECPEGYKRLFR